MFAVYLKRCESMNIYVDRYMGILSCLISLWISHAKSFSWVSSCPLLELADDVSFVQTRDEVFEDKSIVLRILEDRFSIPWSGRSSPWSSFSLECESVRNLEEDVYLTKFEVSNIFEFINLLVITWFEHMAYLFLCSHRCDDNTIKKMGWENIRVMLAKSNQ